MLGKNRDSLSIVAAILDAASSGAGKTRIMCRTNLSFAYLKKCLDVAVETDSLHFNLCGFVAIVT
jgi:predicted transcriptional regulator